MANPIFIMDIGPDGIVATHPARVELPVLVAPVPEERKDKDFNAIRPQLVTLGCMQLPGRGFEFDSSFVSPQSAGRFTKFAALMQALKEQDEEDPKRFPPCSVFGHADPTGPEDYNKTLSGRRARAVYGLLTRNKKIWDALYNVPFGGDRWGVRSIRLMLSIPLKAGEPAFYTGPIEPGDSGAEKSAVQKQTHDAVAAYQESRGIAVPGTGFPGDKTREKLFNEYMDAICQDKTGQPFQLAAERDFLARAKDKNLKGDVQGCGEFNEIFLLTQEEEDAAKKDKKLQEVRNELYRVNRRVLVYIFKHGAEIDYNKWPCPRSIEGPAECAIRFWSDHKDRRKRGAERRTFGQDMDLFERDDDGNLMLDAGGKPTPRNVQETGNTMACRWYHAFAGHSPCERKMEEWIVRIRIQVASAKDKEPVPLAGRRYVVTAGEASYSPVIRGTTNDRGEIRIPVFDEHVKMKLKLDAWQKLFEYIPKDGGGKSSDKSAKPGEESKPGGAAPGSPVATDEFPDEDKFMTFELDAGALKKMAAAPGEMPSKQRLFNLGFGGPLPPAKWTDDDLKEAVRRYRKKKGLKAADANLDGDTREALKTDHELADGGAVEESSDETAAASAT